VAGGTDGAGLVAVALAFGFTLMALAYAFGPVSGTHVNPAVTLAVLLAKRIDGRTAAGYMAAQVAGAIVGAFALWLLVETGDVTDQTGALGTNAYDNGAINLWGALLLEFLLTAVFVGVILLVTDERINTPVAGAAIGVALTAVHLVGIPLTGTSVNPARSLGPALFAGGDALAQVWLFIVAPLAGAVGAWAVWALTRPAAD
jgi:aquaporin Z